MSPAAVAIPIVLNGAPDTVPDGATVADLLARLGLLDQDGFHGHARRLFARPALWRVGRAGTSARSLSHVIFGRAFCSLSPLFRGKRVG